MYKVQMHAGSKLFEIYHKDNPLVAQVLVLNGVAYLRVEMHKPNNNLRLEDFLG